jgi:TrmH family RNA methyltransferase
LKRRIRLKHLTSDSNPLFRRWLRLASSPRAVRELGQTLAEGLHLAQAIGQSRWPVIAALIRRGAEPDPIEHALAWLPPPTERYQLSASLYDRIAPVEHGAGLTLVIPAQSAPVPAGSRQDLIYLDAIQDPSNVGAVLRAAAAAGVAHALCAPATAAAWSPRALRAAMGAHFRLRISEGVGADALGAALAGTWIGAVVQPDAPSLWTCQIPRGPVGWAFGAEGSGLSTAVLTQCALRVRIPMSRQIESLNVASAAAVCLFERSRRAQTDRAGGSPM